MELSSKTKGIVAIQEFQGKGNLTQGIQGQEVFRISVVSEIFPYCPTAQIAEFMFPNVAYRATVYRTGGR